MTPLLIFALFGLAYGIVLQRSGFCFARVGYELFLLRTREAVTGVLAAFATATIGFAIIAALRAHAGLDPTGHLLLIPFGWGTVVGGVLFGLGLTLAGMCAVGTLLRIGEGYVVAWVSLLGLLVGAALDPFRWFVPERWKIQCQGLWLGGAVGLPAAAALTVLIVMLCWYLTARHQDGRRADFSPRALLVLPVIGGLLLGLVNTLQAAYAGPWTVAYPLALVAGSSTIAAARPLLVLNAALVLGAFVSAALGQRYRLKWPRRKQEVLVTLAGGVLMGWGIQLARGCSIGGGFSALASLSLSAWLFLPGVLLGAFLGVQVTRRLP